MALLNCSLSSPNNSFGNYERSDNLSTQLTTRLLQMVSYDSLATITTPGYLGAGFNSLAFINNDHVLFTYGPQGSQTTGHFILTIFGGVTLLSSSFLAMPSTFSAVTKDATANTDASTIAVPLSSNGSGALSFNNAYGRYAMGSFTLAQIQNAFTTSIEIIPAPGAGFMTLIDYFGLELVFGSAAYTGGGAAYLQYGSTAHGTNYATSVTGIPATVFTSLSANFAVYTAGQMNATTGLATSVTGNAAITYTNATAVFAGGTGGSARWYVYYSIVPIL